MRRLARMGSAYAEATGWLGGAALALLVVGLLALLAELVSPSFLLWSGRRVQGVELGDTVNYQFDGGAYSFAVQGRPQEAPPLRVTVYVNSSEPRIAVLDRLSTRIGDAAFVLTPLVAAGACALGGWRRVRRIKRRRPPPGAQGYGFAPGELRNHG